VAADTVADRGIAGLVHGRRVGRGYRHSALDKRHLHLEWGNVAGWVGGVGTFAAFTALVFTALEWRTGQADWREQEADQARLIVPLPASQLNPGMEEPEQCVMVRNQSAVLAIDLILVHVSDGRVEAGGPRITYPYLPAGDTTVLMPVAAGVHADSLTAVDHFAFNFTDAGGRRWCRVGRSQPVRANTSVVGRQIDGHAAGR
jgi:hypothetical protein